MWPAQLEAIALQSLAHLLELDFQGALSFDHRN
jgi:hypothetical protein